MINYDLNNNIVIYYNDRVRIKLQSSKFRTTNLKVKYLNTTTES